MNYNSLTLPQQGFIDNLTNYPGALRDIVIDCFIHSPDWQTFRMCTFKNLDLIPTVIDLIKKDLMSVNTNE